MGCGASKNSNPKAVAPEEAATKKKATLAEVAAAAHITGDTNSTGSRSGKASWVKLQAAVQSGLYATWDAYDLPLDGAEEDYFETFDDDEDDYKMFLPKGVDYAECDHIVNWSDKLMDKLAKDKSARGAILQDAYEYGQQFSDVQDRHITVIYNPFGGGGKARRMVSAMVIPVLQLTKHKFKVMPTKARRHAVEIVRDLDVDSTDALIVCGGDGLVHEVVTGYFMNPKLDELKKKIHLGICPCGTANAMANAMHTHKVCTQIAIVGRAALATCKGKSRPVDVIKCVQDPIPESTEPELQGPDPNEIYALSCFGWGMAGAVALKADKLRWIPGQRSMRYDIAGFVSLISDWPVADTGTLEYREVEPNSDEVGPWKKTEISLINLICTNLDKLGKKHPIYPGVAPDDGRLLMAYIDAKCNRRRVVKLGLGMKKGKWLGKGKGVVAYSLREFKVTPTEFKSPYCIDGDPHDVSSVHVTCLPRALNLFYLPSEDTGGTGKPSGNFKDHAHGPSTEAASTEATPAEATEAAPAEATEAAPAEATEAAASEGDSSPGAQNE